MFENHHLTQLTARSRRAERIRNSAALACARRVTHLSQIRVLNERVPIDCEWRVLRSLELLDQEVSQEVPARAMRRSTAGGC